MPHRALGRCDLLQQVELVVAGRIGRGQVLEGGGKPEAVEGQEDAAAEEDRAEERQEDEREGEEGAARQRVEPAAEGGEQQAGERQRVEARQQV